jgi:hypothetical protein
MDRTLQDYATLGEHVYRVHVSPNRHRDVHVVNLKPHLPSLIGPTWQLFHHPEEREHDEEKDEWNVERIVRHREKHGRLEFLVRWEKFGPEEDTWEPSSLRCDTWVPRMTSALRDGQLSLLNGVVCDNGTSKGKRAVNPTYACWIGDNRLRRGVWGLDRR